MAISTRVLSPSTPILGIKGETTFGVALDSTDADGTAYSQLPVVNASKPAFTPGVHDYAVRSGNTMGAIGDGHHSMKGGSVSVPFEFWATPDLLAQFMTLATQNHVEASDVHTSTVIRQNTIGGVGGTITSGMPSSVNIAYDTGTAGEGIRVCGAIVSDLTMAISAGSNANLLTMSGNFFSGHSNPTATGTALEQTFEGTWVEAQQVYFPLCSIVKKQLKVDGTAVDIVIKDLSITITPASARTPGGDTDCNATSIIMNPWTVTGSMSFKYDGNANYADGTNVMQDFIDGAIATLEVEWGDGTVSSAGEMNWDAQLRYSGDPGQDLSDGGIFHTVEFDCKPSSSVAAFTTQIYSTSSVATW